MKKFVRTQSLKYLHDCNVKETRKRVWYKHDVVIFKMKAQELLTVYLHEICLRITVFKYTQIKGTQFEFKILSENMFHCRPGRWSFRWMWLKRPFESPHFIRAAQRAETLQSTRGKLPCLN